MKVPIKYTDVFLEITNLELKILLIFDEDEHQTWNDKQMYDELVFRKAYRKASITQRNVLDGMIVLNKKKLLAELIYGSGVVKYVLMG